MKKNISWILVCVLMIVLIGGAAVLYNRLGDSYRPDQLASQPPETEAAEETQPMTAPDFTVTDADGNEVNLSDFFGKPIVLNFWASWCGPCKMEMPDFDEAYTQQGEQIQFLMVNMTDGSRETLETAKSFVAESGFGFPVYYDTSYEAAMTYGVSSLPTTYFISAEGHLTAWAAGAIDMETLQRGIDMIHPKAGE